jgi:glycosyltransferase involved in cell wall biosynthesis
MKILIGCSSPPDRGSGILTYTKELCESLIQLGVEVHFLSPVPQDGSWLEQHGIHHIGTAHAEDPIASARRVLHYIRDRRIDGAINNDNPVLQSIAPGLSCPLVVIGHLNKMSIAALACYRHQWSDYVVAISNDMQRAYVLKHGVPSIKCPVIHNGMRDPGHDGSFDQKTPNILRVIYAGDYSRRKGADLALRAILAGREAWRGAKLDWFGAVPDRVKKRVAGLPYVRLHGHVPREALLRALRQADVFLLPSRAEGCPMAMLEAMSLGIVPISSDGTGAMRWLIDSGVEGYICQLKRWPEQALECLQYLRDHPVVLSKMKRSVRERFMRQFQSINVAARLLQLIQQPTVDRSQPEKSFRVLCWHRPQYRDGMKAPLLDRLCMRLGVLRSAGVLDTTT